MIHVNGLFTLEADEAISEGLRVAYSSGKAVLADATSEDIGVAAADAADGDQVSIIPNCYNGVIDLVASEVITAGDELFPADDGQVSTTGVTGNGKWIAMAAAAAAGDMFKAVSKATSPDTEKLSATIISAAGTSEAPTAVTLAQLKGGLIVQSYAGASYIEFATPSASDAGLTVIVSKTGSAGAVTISTAGTEQIAGGDTLATIDAQYDIGILVWSGTAWVLAGAQLAA